LNPSPGDAIKEDRSLASLVDQINPRTPKIWEAFGTHNAIESIPANGVKSFAKVQFKDRNRCSAPVASLDNVSSINKVFGNGSARDEASLIGVNKVGDELTDAESKALGMDLETAVLKRYGPEIFRSVCARFFWEQDNVGFIDGAKVRGKRVEVRKRI
jgi:hypothetical protein